MYIAFYKGNYKWWSRLIKWWTNASYSHCEFYDGNFLIGISDEQRVRKKLNKLNPNKWDIYELKGFNRGDLEDFYHKTQGAKYDWLGILLTYIFNMRRHNKNKYTCSEWVGEVIDKKYDIILPKNYYSLSPQDIHDILVYKKLINK